MPITTEVVSSNTTHGKVYLIQHYVIKFVSDLRQVSGFICWSEVIIVAKTQHIYTPAPRRGIYCFTSVRLFIPPFPEGGGGYTVFLPSVQDIFRRIFLSNCWWQRSDIWSQASYRYPISWEVFLDPSDSYFLIAEERGYHKWELAHSSSCSQSNSFGGK